MGRATQARRINRIIQRNGNTIKLPDGTEIIAVVSEDAARITESISAQDLEEAKGRLVLFRMSQEDYRKIPEGMLLPYNGRQYTLRPVRSVDLANVNFFVAVLGASGGYG